VVIPYTLLGVVRECYEDATLKATDDRFTVHMTLMKMSVVTSRWRNQTGIDVLFEYN
jgi:hypothetical protein